eukprot:TRINITY_DN60695_c0_g1_i1.p2 TRINITY_DN60695_c0_g1~~TRINITY_DN60695_c0_g1_i1.p2  ORF type:complete len:133 (-),score=13.34 TRINITY_DN60695_c0_g1_i1:183-581(-)
MAMLHRSCTVAGVTLSGDSEKTQLHNGTDKVITCEIFKHGKDGSAMDLTDREGTVNRKWQWTLNPGESRDDKSDYDVVFKSYSYTARVTTEDEFVAGFRIHGGPLSWTGPWLEVRGESDSELYELRQNWSES